MAGGCLLRTLPSSLWLAGLHLDFFRLHTSESSSSCHLAGSEPQGTYGVSGHLSIRLFSASPAVTLSCQVGAPCGNGGHLRIDLVLESQTSKKREPLVSSSLDRPCRIGKSELPCCPSPDLPGSGRTGLSLTLYPPPSIDLLRLKS